MFYTLIQDPHPIIPNATPICEKWLAFEACSLLEALVRATWFGIDLNESNAVGRERWLWYHGYGTTVPMVGAVPLETNTESGDWLVLYLNGSLKSSIGIREQMELSGDEITTLETAQQMIEHLYRLSLNNTRPLQRDWIGNTNWFTGYQGRPRR
jgi:hypothetical protein